MKAEIVAKIKTLAEQDLVLNSLNEFNELVTEFYKIQDEEGAFHAAVGSLGLDEHGHDEGIKGFKLSSKLRKLDRELSYSEFIEGIAAIAVYKDPDPYIPLKQKIDTFLTQDIL